MAPLEVGKGVKVGIAVITTAVEVGVEADVAVAAGCWVAGTAVAGAVAVGFNAASMVILEITVAAASVRIEGMSCVGGTTTVGELQPTRIKASARMATIPVVLCMRFMSIPPLDCQSPGLLLLASIFNRESGIVKGR
jgi:hypothetical protein